MRAFFIALSLTSPLTLAACEKAPRPDPGHWEQAKAKSNRRWEEVELKTVKFDVGKVPSAGPRQPRSKLDPRPVSLLRSGCNEAAAEELSMRVSAGPGGKVEVHVSGYRYYCTPSPNFGAGMDGERLVVTELAPTAPPSRCTCLHDLAMEIADVPSGEREVQLFSRLGEDGDPVPEARATVSVVD